MSDPEFSFRVVDSDDVVPCKIDHNVDEIFNDGSLEQKYNFVDYIFKSDDSWVRARTYLDEAESVTIFGPFDAEDSEEEVSDPALMHDVILYMARRFDFIEVVGDDGFETIWQSRPYAS